MFSEKIYRFIFFATLFLIVFFVSALVSFHTVLRGEMVTLPNVVGKTMEEAKVELDKKKLFIKNEGEKFDSRWERGKVIFQDPSPGSKLNMNKVVRVILSAGSEKVIVPEITRINIQLAGEILKKAGLTKGKVSQVHTSEYSAGKIFAQCPLWSEEVARNSLVSLLVSQGQREKKYIMPDFIGRRSGTVMAKLRELNFRVEDARPVYYPGLEPGIIIKQFPPHGFVIQKNYPITLEVSK